MSLSAQDIIGRCADAEQERARLKSYIDAAYDYAIPWRKKPTGALMPRVFDSSGPAAVINFAGRLGTAIMPEQGAFALRPGPLVEHLATVEERENEDRRLELTTAIVETSLAASNYALRTQEAFCDLALSTGAILMAPGDSQRPIRSISVPAYELALEEGPFGELEVWHWKRQIKRRDIARLFPSVTLSQSLSNETDSKKMVEVTQTTYFDAKANVYRTAVVIEREIVQETEHRASPWITPRYWKTPGMAWGIGPLLLALADIRTLNKNMELVLMAAELAVAPPMLVSDDGVINPDAIEIGPYSVVRVNRMGGAFGKPIEPLNMGGRVDIGQNVSDEARARINRVMMNQNLPSETGAVRSPTEYLERAKAHQMDTNGAFGRLAREFVGPSVLRAIDILDQLKIPGVEWKTTAPDAYVRKVQVTGQLARAAQLDDATNFVHFMQILKDVGGPEMMGLLVKVEDEMGWLADKMGIGASRLRTKAERDQMQKAAADQMAQMAQQQATQQQGGPQGQMGPADNMPEDLLGAAA